MFELTMQCYLLRKNAYFQLRPSSLLVLVAQLDERFANQTEKRHLVSVGVVTGYRRRVPSLCMEKSEAPMVIDRSN